MLACVLDVLPGISVQAFNQVKLLIIIKFIFNSTTLKCFVIFLLLLQKKQNTNRFLQNKFKGYVHD